MPNQSKTAPEKRDDFFREMASNGAVCQSQSCPKREHCLRSILKDYVPEQDPVATIVNLRNPRMQTEDCPRFCPDQPVRMPLGLSKMYYEMPGHLVRSVKNHLIALFSRRRYYDYHCGRRPITPAVEATIRQTLLAYGWTQEPTFNSYIEEYLL